MTTVQINGANLRSANKNLNYRKKQLSTSQDSNRISNITFAPPQNSQYVNMKDRLALASEKIEQLEDEM
jgi:hypothetical protein